MTKQNFIFSAPTQLAISSGTRRYKKEIIKTGTYANTDDTEFKVSKDKLNHWVIQFQLMKKNGVKVPVPLDHSFDADKNRGWVREMYVEGSSLIAEIEMIGEDACKELERNDVSIYAPIKFRDGKGNEYLQPITHVALTSYPLIQGMKPAEIMASSNSHPTIVYSLKEIKPEIEKEDNASSKEPDMDYTKIKEHLNIDTEITNENVIEMVCAAYDKRPVEIKEVEKIVEVEKIIEKIVEVPIDLKLENKVDDTLVRENISLRLSSLVEKNCITPAIAKKLEEMVKTISFSSAQKNYLTEILEIIKENKLPDRTEYSGPQILELSHDVKENKLSMNDWVNKKYNLK